MNHDFLKNPFDGKPFIIAEVGGNHEGNFEYAKKLLKEASSTGVNAVKFQIYSGEKIVNILQSPERVTHFKKFELLEKEWHEIIEMAKNLNVLFMASVWDFDSLELYDPYISIHKIGSGDLTAYPLLEAIAKKNKPLIISTAMATLDEVSEAIKVIDKANPDLIANRKLAVLHCVAMYGKPHVKYANLLSIKKLADTYPNIVVGYSDHTEGIYACELALSMGAQIIEKHFTDDKSREFRDHHISATVEEMKKLVLKASEIKTYLGIYEKEPVKEIETTARIKEFRRAIYPKYDLIKGDILTPDNTVILRPNEGIDARKYSQVIGKKLAKPKKALEKLEFGDFL